MFFFSLRTKNLSVLFKYLISIKRAGTIFLTYLYIYIKIFSHKSEFQRIKMYHDLFNLRLAKKRRCIVYSKINPLKTAIFWQARTHKIRYKLFYSILEQHMYHWEPPASPSTSFIFQNPIPGCVILINSEADRRAWM